MKPAITLAALLLAGGCGHGEPFGTTTPGPLDLLDPTLPRRLTFNVAADVGPSVIGDTLVFSRADPNRADGDVCLALLPVAGGRLTRVACAGGPTTNTVRDSWLDPAISPDRRRVAFVHERRAIATGSLVGRALVVAALDDPASVALRVTRLYPLPGGGLGNGFHRLSWAGDNAVRFLGGLETVGSRGGFLPSGVFEVPVGGDSAPVAQVVPELTDAIAYAVGEDDTVYFASGADSAFYRWAAGSPPVPDGPWDCPGGSGFGGFTDVAAGGDVLAVIVICIDPVAGPRRRLLARDVAGGTARAIDLPFEPEAVAGVPSRPWVVVEAAGDLWLVALRAAAATSAF